MDWLSCPVSPPAIKITDAPCAILTGDDWAPWFEWAINSAETQILLSVYMISHHWRDPATGKLNLTQTLANAAARGLCCRGIVDQPNVAGRKEPYNIGAARQLKAAGWGMRKVPDRRTLHEKLLIIDKRIVYVGSHNISKASAVSNYDTGLVIESPELAAAMERHFWARWRIAFPLDAKV